MTAPPSRRAADPALDASPWLAGLLVARLLLAGLLPTLSSCAGTPVPPAVSPPPGTVIQVGPYAVDGDDLARAVRALHGEDATFDSLDAGQRQATVDALVAARLLALEARRRGLHTRADVVAALDSTERHLLRSAFYEREVYGPLAAPGDSACRALYDEWGRGAEVRAAHILLRSRQEAEAVLGRLAAGEDFTALAQGESVHTLSNLQGGDMGFLRRGQVPEAIAAQVWDLPAGAVAPQPVATPLGWHVVRVVDRRTRTLEEQRAALVAELERRARLAAEARLHDSLRVAFQVRYDAATAAAVAGLRDTLAGDRRLFTWTGGHLDLAGFLRRARVPDPVTSDTARMRRLGEGLVFDDLTVVTARARGYGADASIKRALQEKEFALLNQALYETVTTPAPSPDTLRVFFAAHGERFRGPQRLTIREILVDDAALADSLHARVVAGESMEALARRFTVRRDLARTGGLWEDVNGADPRSSRIYRHALERGTGLQPPLKVPGGVSVLEVLEIAPGTLPTFETAGQDAVRQGYDAWRMDQLIADLRRRHADDIRVAPP